MNKVERFPRQPPGGVGNRPPPPTKFDWKPMIGAEVNRDHLREALERSKGPYFLRQEGYEQVQDVDAADDLVRLLLDGPLSDILELRGEQAEEAWWCGRYAEAWTPDSYRAECRGDVLAQLKEDCAREHVVNGCGPRLLVKQGTTEGDVR